MSFVWKKRSFTSIVQDIENISAKLFATFLHEKYLFARYFQGIIVSWEVFTNVFKKIFGFLTINLRISIDAAFLPKTLESRLKIAIMSSKNGEVIREVGIR